MLYLLWLFFVRNFDLLPSGLICLSNQYHLLTGLYTLLGMTSTQRFLQVWSQGLEDARYKLQNISGVSSLADNTVFTELELLWPASWRKTTLVENLLFSPHLYLVNQPVPHYVLLCQMFLSHIQPLPGDWSLPGALLPMHLFLPQKVVVKRAVVVSFHIALPLAIKQVVKIASY